MFSNICALPIKGISASWRFSLQSVARKMNESVARTLFLAVCVFAVLPGGTLHGTKKKDDELEGSLQTDFKDIQYLHLGSSFDNQSF